MWVSCERHFQKIGLKTALEIVLIVLYLEQYFVTNKNHAILCYLNNSFPFLSTGRIEKIERKGNWEYFNRSDCCGLNDQMVTIHIFWVEDQGSMPKRVGYVYLNNRLTSQYNNKA